MVRSAVGGSHASIMLIQVDRHPFRRSILSHAAATVFAVSFDREIMQWRTVWVDAENTTGPVLVNFPVAYRPHKSVKLPFIALVVGSFDSRVELHERDYIILLDEQTWIVSSSQFKITELSEEC